MIQVTQHENRVTARDSASRTSVTLWDNGEVDIENHVSVYLTEQLVGAVIARIKDDVHKAETNPHGHVGQGECPACL